MSENVQDVRHSDSSLALTWRMDAVEFNDALIRLFRDRDTVQPRVAMDEIGRDSIELIPSSDGEKINDVIKMLDRLAVLGAASLRFRHHWLFDTFVRTSLNIYLSGFDSTGNRSRQAPGLTGSVLWPYVISRVSAVGAYAVRLEEWAAVRKLALQSFPHSSSGEAEHWLRHTTIKASWEKLLDSSGLKVVKGGELISVTRKLIDEEPALRCDLPQQDERLLNSITQFDLLAQLIVSMELGAYNTSHVYPSMAGWELRRAEPVVIKLLADADIREKLFGGSYTERLLANALRETQVYAYNINYKYEMGWASRQVRELFSRNPEVAAGA